MQTLEKEVSFFPHYWETDRPHTGKFINIVKSAKLAEKWGPVLTQIRATTDKTTRDKLKAQLPCFTPSGVFSHRGNDALLKHSGLIQFDIDPKENDFLNGSTAPDLRKEVFKLKQVAYCALSASGAGVWGVVPIEHPEQHAEHFTALYNDFKQWGISIDTACKDVARLRYWSYDPDACFRVNATTYTKLAAEPARKPSQTARVALDDFEAVKFDALLNLILTRQIDITGNYTTWFALGCDLAGKFGENGRACFHQISQFYPKYSYSETDKQFTNCLRWKHNGNNDLNTFFARAKDCGIYYKDHLPSLSTHTPPPAPAPPPPVELPAPPTADQWPDLAFVPALARRFDFRFDGVTPINDAPPAAPDHFANQVEQLAERLSACTLPAGAVSLDAWQTITNPQVFVAGHLDFLRGIATRQTKRPYFERLSAFAGILEQQATQ